MKAVLDTNVLISGVISTGVTHDLLVSGFRGEYDIVVSVVTLTEFRETLLAPEDHAGKVNSPGSASDTRQVPNAVNHRHRYKYEKCMNRYA